jgi:hypothetical protein
VGGLGAVKHREFKMASGEMSPAEFERFLKTVFANMAEVSVNGAVHFICMDWRHLAEVMGAAQGIYSGLKNLCVWNKNNGGMGSFYRSKHELVFVYKVGTDPHVNTVELGTHGRYRTNVWDYAGVNTWRAGREADLEMHPTVKPTALVIDAIKDCSRRVDVVLDAFSGSGTTIIAAHVRIGQTRDVDVHIPISLLPQGKASFDQNLHALLERKRRLMRDALLPPNATEADRNELFQATIN